MDEEKQETAPEKKEEVKAEAEATPTENAGEGNKTDITPIEKAEGILKQIDEKLKKSEEVTARMEKAATRMMLGGKADAGEPMKTEEQTAADKNEADIKETIDRFK